MPTDIIKRRVDLYPKSWEQRKRWESAAKKAGMPLSKFLALLIDDALESSPTENKKQVNKLKQELITQSDEIKELNRELSRVKKLLSMQEDELEEYRNNAFTDKTYTGVRVFNRELIDTLRRSGTAFSNEDLLKRVGVSPTEPDKVKAISAQLEALLACELISFSPKGWRWKE